MAKKSLKKFTEQWDSLAVITICTKNTAIQITSEGCGAAGDVADALVNMAGSIINDAMEKHAQKEG